MVHKKLSKSIKFIKVDVPKLPCSVGSKDSEKEPLDRVARKKIVEKLTVVFTWCSEVIRIKPSKAVL